jgi:hypothetical protein
MAGGKKQDEGAALAARIALGGIAGAAALTALAITLHRARGRRRAPITAAFDPSPRVADAVAATGVGAMLAAVHPAPGRIEGALAGSGWWLAGHMGWLPAAAIGPARLKGEGRPSEMLLAYAAWGWTLAVDLRAREAARVNRPSD